LPTQAAFDRQQLTQDVRISTKKHQQQQRRKLQHHGKFSAAMDSKTYLGNPDNIMPAVRLLANNYVLQLL